MSFIERAQNKATRAPTKYEEKLLAEIDSLNAKVARLEAEKAELRRQLKDSDIYPSIPFEKINSLIEGKGIYLGVWPLKDRHGTELGLFSVFAAPEDLKNAEGNPRMTFAQASEELCRGTKWYGIAGRRFDSEPVLAEALRSKSYKGEWFIPPKILMIADGPCLYQNRNKGALARTLSTDPSDGNDEYMTCTALLFAPDVTSVKFSSGTTSFLEIDEDKARCRPFRLERIDANAFRKARL
ncbi:MAG: hypothetical protein PHE27_03075 [Alphaproteobacteria bacterium]|nr:hypothetical protein [Alphaproteobacteria bacterium]